MTSNRPPVYMYIPDDDAPSPRARDARPSPEASSRFIPPSALPGPPYAAENRLTALEGNLRDDATSYRAWERIRAGRRQAEADYAERMEGAEQRRQSIMDERVSSAAAESKRVREVAERVAFAKTERELAATTDLQDATCAYLNNSVLRAEAAAERRQRALEDLSAPAGAAFEQAMGVRDGVAEARGREDEERRQESAEEEARRAARMQEQAAAFKEEEARIVREYQETLPTSPALPPSGMSYEA